MKIYFAGSIRGGREDQALYLDIIELLKRHGFVLTEHVGNQDMTADGETMSSRMIHDRDLAWLQESKCVVAEVTTPSLGVGYEIAKASEWGKPVLCLFRPDEGRLLSAMILGCKDVTVREYGAPTELNKLIDDFFGGL